MKKEVKDQIQEYEYFRDEYLHIGNQHMAIYYQSGLIHVIEESGKLLFKDKNLRHNRDVLYDMLEDLFGFRDITFFEEIYFYIVLAGYLTEDISERDIAILKKTRDKANVYIQELLNIHISIIDGLEQEGKRERAKGYVNRILTLLKNRYGMLHTIYADMYLHIIGEWIYAFDKEKFSRIFQKNYGYFEKFLAGKDIFLETCVCFYADELVGKKDEKYIQWLNKCENLLEQDKNNNYLMLKCNVQVIKARALWIKNERNASILLMQDAISKFIKKDVDNDNIFYANVYYCASARCFEMKNYTLMYEMAVAGIEMCERIGAERTELYYLLYNSIGLKYITDNQLQKAAEIYSSRIRQVKEIFGVESESFIYYTNNLAMIALKQGRMEDAKFYFRNIDEIQNDELKENTRTVFSNAMLIEGLENDDAEETLYNKFLYQYRRPGDEVWLRVQTNHLWKRVSKDYFGKKDVELMKELLPFFKDSFKGELNALYWSSVIVYEMSIHNIDVAYQISISLMKEIPQNVYIYYIFVVLNHVQLLIIKKKIKEAIDIIIYMLELERDCILQSGYENSETNRSVMRILVSMYIYLVQSMEKEGQSYASERNRLFEWIVECKTIEKEMLSVLSKYEPNDEDASFAMYMYRLLRRKLSALQLRKRDLGQNNDDFIEEYIHEKKEYESKLFQKIDITTFVKKFKLCDVNIPSNSICIEYFAYFHFDYTKPIIRFLMREDEEIDYCRYLVCLINGGYEGNNISILESVKEQDVWNWDDEDIIVQVEKARKILIQPICKYLGSCKYVYIGLDYLLHFIPFSLVFDSFLDIGQNVVLMDSVRYFQKDERIIDNGTTSLIIGRPTYGIDNTYEGSPEDLYYSEKECSHISKLLKSCAYLGENATQKIFNENHQKDIIHISTHGDCVTLDNIKDESILVNSYVALSGISNWKNNAKNKEYGNGMITADDFIFTDLSTTKLVVISACESGLGNCKGLDEPHGMRWAIEVAGAHYSVVSLWSVDDMSTAILMILFYRNLLIMPIIRAFEEAKRRLRTITIGELQNDIVLWDVVGDCLECEGNMDWAPFSDWQLWAAFVCYCNGGKKYGE